MITTKLTHADLLAMPEALERREIIEGELIVTPSPRFGHQNIVLNLAFALRQFLKAHRIGTLILSPMDTILSDSDVLEPDLIFVRSEREEIIEDWVRGAPDLVVEVLSPATAKTDRGAKLKTYARFGVAEYWIVDPERNLIEVYRGPQRGYELAEVLHESDSLTSPVLPGFSLLVSEVFGF